jgi:hypothetical protein
LQVLVHELIHVTLDNEDGHTGRFRAIAKMVGLESPLLEVHADLALTEQCEWLTKELGEYPHAGMDKLAEILTGAPVGPGGVPISGSPMRRWTSGPKTQTARMIKCMCPVDSCGYSLRTTRRWIDVATPICPVHLSAMTVGA